MTALIKCPETQVERELKGGRMMTAPHILYHMQFN